MARKQSAALAVAKSWVGRTYPHGWCQKWVVTEVFASGGVGDWDGDRAADAEDGWKAAKKKVATPDPAKVPAGLPIYFIGGSRDNGHAAVSAGNGMMYSTDRPNVGRVGHVPIKSVEKPWGVKFVGYVTTDGNGHNLLDAPKPKPVKAPLWFGIDFRNFAGFDAVRGKKTFDKRLPALIKDIHTVNRAFVCAVEIPDPKVEAVTNAMQKIGYSHLAGDLGRHIFAHVGIVDETSKMFDLQPRYKYDSKQGVGVIAKPTGDNAVGICTAQLENQDASGTAQVKQADNLVDQFEAFCDFHEIAESRRFYVVDGNSDNRVRREVFNKRGYVDVFDVAFSSENGAWRSIAKWFKRPTKGKRIDLIAVPKGRPVVRARLRIQTSNLSDHLDQFADIGSL